MPLSFLNRVSVADQACFWVNNSLYPNPQLAFHCQDHLKHSRNWLVSPTSDFSSDFWRSPTGLVSSGPDLLAEVTAGRPVLLLLERKLSATGASCHSADISYLKVILAQYLTLSHHFIFNNTQQKLAIFYHTQNNMWCHRFHICFIYLVFLLIYLSTLYFIYLHTYIFKRPSVFPLSIHTVLKKYAHSNLWFASRPNLSTSSMI